MLLGRHPGKVLFQKRFDTVLTLKCGICKLRHGRARRQVCSFPKFKLGGKNKVAVEYKENISKKLQLFVITFYSLGSVETFVTRVKAEAAARKKRKKSGNAKKKPCAPCLCRCLPESFLLQN